MNPQHVCVCVCVNARKENTETLWHPDSGRKHAPEGGDQVWEILLFYLKHDKVMRCSIK